MLVYSFRMMLLNISKAIIDLHNGKDFQAKIDVLVLQEVSSSTWIKFGL